MPKYNFDRLDSTSFESLVQALVDARYRTQGKLTQFGAGADGAREATWVQPIEHPEFLPVPNGEVARAKHWVFQAKYHDIGQIGWGPARTQLLKELDHELRNVHDKYEIPCDHYVLVTNVPLTGVRHRGTIDKLQEIIKVWEPKIPAIEVWSATDLCAMLDKEVGVRTSYLDQILPGDVLQNLLVHSSNSTSPAVGAIRGYLKSLLETERDAKAQEAGDDQALRLEKVYVDLTLKFQGDGNDASSSVDADAMRLQREPGDEIGAANALLTSQDRFIFLEGGPGAGKSTLTQFVALYQAARLSKSSLAIKLAERTKPVMNGEKYDLDSRSPLRMPFRIELRRYAQWISGREASETVHIAEYLVDKINRATASLLGIEDLYKITQTNPVLLILDGLDEVPNSDTRNTIFTELDAFLARCTGESADICTILSSRPNGYRGEFQKYTPVRWRVALLERKDFDEYVRCWLNDRVSEVDERSEISSRIEDGMESSAVQQLATTLLQATVILTIARRGHRIPHARLQLFRKYVEVIFDRERNKQMVRSHIDELHHLHERIGYELLRKMERNAGSNTISASEFDQYVNEIISDYSSSDLGGSTIAETSTEIRLLANDRLCFIGGVGESQTEYDFVIQSFREYFAAAYLSKHEDADVDRVFESLWYRAGFWSNVLQFYVAQQSNAQQKVWIGEMDGANFNLENPVDLARLATLRLTMITLLPEFDKPRNQDVYRALKQLMSPNTRFVWSNFREDSRYLEAFSQQSRSSIEKLLLEDIPALSKDLHMLHFLGCMKSEILQDRLVQVLADGEIPATEVIEIATTHDIDLSDDVLVEADYVQDIRRAVGGTGSLENLPMIGSRRNLLEVWANHGFRPTSRHIPERISEEIRNWLFDKGDFFKAHGEEVKLPAYIGPRFDISEEAIKMLEDGGEVCAYVLALYNSSRNYYDPNLYYEAISKELASINNPIWKVDWQIGPGPTSFPSVSEWAERRVKLASLQLQNQNISLEHKSSIAYLFFHPSDWLDQYMSALEEEEKRSLNLIRSVIHQEHVGLWARFYLPPNKKIPLSEIVQHAMLKGENGEATNHDLGIPELFSGVRIEFDPCSKPDIDSYLKRYFALQPNLRPYSLLLVLLAAATGDIGVDQLKLLWADFYNSSSILSWHSLPRAVLEMRIESELGELLKSSDIEDLILGFYLCNISKDATRMTEKIRIKLMPMILPVLASRSELELQLLIRSSGFRLEEIRLWLTPSVVSHLDTKNVDYEQFIVDEITQMDLDSDGNEVQHLELLGEIVHDDQVSSNIRSVVHSAMRSIMERKVEPLDNTHWQKV